jgi:actin-related protein 5
MISYLHRLLQLKYPCHMSAATFSRAEVLVNWIFAQIISLLKYNLQELIHDYGYIAESYQEELEKWTNTDYYDQQVRKLQLPFVAPASSTVTAQSLEQQQQRRRENVKRLIEINAKKREERVRYL